MKSREKSIVLSVSFLTFCIVLIQLLLPVQTLMAQSGSNLGSYGTHLQPGLLRGHVTRGGSPVAGAKIMTLAGHSTQSDGSGFYQIYIGAPGLYSVAASSQGDSQTASAEILSGQTTVLDFQFQQFPTWILNLLKTGAGTGVVTSNPSGLDCGSTCSAEFAEGTAIELTAVPSEGSVFAGWSGGGCSGTGACQLQLDADTTVTADFQLAPVQEFELSIVKNGTGSGTVTSLPTGIDCGATCSSNFPAGSMIDLSAAATPGSVFVGWSGGGCSGSAGCQVDLDADTTVTATFDQAVVETFTLSVKKNGTGAGTVSSSPTGIDCGPTCSSGFAASTEVTLSAGAAAGSYFAGWSGGGCSGTENCVVEMASDTEVRATFNLAAGPERSIPTLAEWGCFCSPCFSFSLRSTS